MIATDRLDLWEWQYLKKINNKPLSFQEQDEVSFKYLYINGRDLQAIEKYGREIHKKLSFKMN